MGRGTVRGTRVGVGLALSAALGSGAALAQVAVPPSSVAPTIEELEAQFEPGTTRPGAADDVGELAEPDLAPQLPVGEDARFSFLLRELRIENSTVYGEADLAPIYEPYVGTEVTVGALREIADRIERLYRDQGYVATRVIIPPQAITQGVATLEVYEGRIIHYEINGEVGPVKEQIANLLDNLLTDAPVRWSDLDRYLLLARDLPGISLTGTLNPAGETVPGGVVLVVEVARKPFDAFISMQNRNADPTGPLTLSAGGALNSNTRFGERIGAVALVALEVPEQISGFMTYEQSIGNDGLRFELSGIHAYSEPGDQLQRLDLVSNTTILDAGLEYPLVRSRKFSLWTRGGFEYADQHVTTGTPRTELYDDQLRVLYAGAQAVWFPPLGGQTEFDVEIRQGTDGLGASANSKFDASTDFTLVRGEFSHEQPIPPFFGIFLGARGQYANKPLPTLEEMALGELSFGRGFEPGALTGDSGAAGTVELRYQPPGIDLQWLDELQTYTFVDYGFVDDRGNPTRNPKGYEQLASFGFGFRFRMFESVLGDVYYAHPVTRALRTAPRRPNPGVKFSLTTFF